MNRGIDMASLKAKVTIITGASFGIGAATAVYFAERLSKLVLVARTEEHLQKVASDCQKKGLDEDSILILPCDVSVESQVEGMVKKVLEKFGRIDVLINNAGIGKYTSILNTKLEDFDAIMKTNVRAPFHLSQLCLPHLVKTKGVIINVSSISGQRAFPGAISYGMSKAALDQMTKVLAVEFATQGVRVNSVNPGVIVTDFQRKAGMNEDVYAVYLDRQKELQPLCGAIDTIEVAKAIAFFASDDSGCITGETLFIDGGRHAKPPL